ncbi:netrin-4-like isoform X2 [Ambystoma mexicanum]|uniref:netrin-4-like isoform X2 n=1 Tax=Ambystoma mexicanum TaxID=8296 RepID=UPI0037E9A912
MQRRGIPWIVLLGWAVWASSEADLVKVQNFRCDGRACNPPVGNLAMGRAPATLTTCGKNSTELYCFYPDQHLLQTGQPACGQPRCTKCNAKQPDNSHLAADMTDDVFVNPLSWWQSAQGVHREEIRLDLESEFYLTHVIVVFKSPRPAAMVLERSQDHGQTWRPYKYFALNCTATFGVQDDLAHEGAICTSRYSDAWPCTRGEVIYRALTPYNRISDPYGPDAQDLMKLTNLRLRLLKRQDCPCQGAGLLEKPQRFAHYAIYDLIVRGSCFCNGHAEECQLVNGTGAAENMVHGKCVCRHGTAGEHCERCAPLYNDLPWKPGDGRTGEPNECRTCSCHPLGATNATFNPGLKCHPKTGFCFCKPGVAGPHCDRCMMGYWGFGEHGCRPCDCSRSCDLYTGKCLDSFDNHHVLNIPIGGRIPDLIEIPANDSKDDWIQWNGEQGFSALRHPEKCVCKERMLGSVADFCQMKYAYVIKARILTAYDKGSHAEVVVKVKKVLKSSHVEVYRSNRSIYPESWTSRGCTCPILNPGTDYLIAGQEDARTGKLLVNMHSLVKPWKAYLGRQVMDMLRKRC